MPQRPSRRTRGALVMALLVSLAAVPAADAARSGALRAAPAPPVVAVSAARPAPPRPAAARTSPAQKVATAVRRARRGAPVPDRLRPPLGRATKDVAGLGRCDYSTGVRRLCRRGDRDGNRRVVVMGDSHARFWIPAFEGPARRHGWQAYYLVKEQCTAAYVLPARNGSGDPNRGCARFRRWSARMVERLDPDLVVVSSSGPSAGIYLDGKRVRDRDRVARAMRGGWHRLLRRLVPLAPRVVLLKDVPKLTADPVPCLRKRARLRACLGTPSSAWRQVAAQSTRAARARRVRVVDPGGWLCWRNTCPAVVGRRGWITYRDRGHLTGTYARTLRHALARALRMTR